MVRSAPTGRGSRPGLLTALLVLVIAALLPAPAALAQFGGAAAPAPISSLELNGYAEMLGLTPQQRAALDPLHDAYKAQYERFRATEVVKFEEQERAANLNGGLDVSRDEVEALFDGSDRLLRRVAGFDRQFFDQALNVLTPAQAARLPRVRLARERTRLRAGEQIGGMPGMQVADLAVVAGRTVRELTPAEQAALDGVLIPYEQRLTRHLGTMRESMQSMMLRVLDAFEAAGLMGTTQEDMVADPELMTEVMEIAQTAFTDAYADVAEAAADAQKLNHRTLFSVMRTVPISQARRFRREAGTTNGFAGVMGMGWPSDVWADALRIGDLEGQRPAVQAGLEATFTNELAVAEPFMRKSQESMARMTPMDMEAMQSAMQEAQASTEKLMERMTALTEAAEIEVAALLGEDWRSRISTSESGEERIFSAIGLAAPGTAVAVGGSVSEAVMFDDMGFDMMLPSRLRWTDLADALIASGLDPESEPMAALEAEFQTYRESVSELPTFVALRERVAEMSAQSFGEEQTNDVDEIVRTARSVNQARRAAMGELAGVESALFASATEATGGDPVGAIARLADRRARTRWMAGAEFASVTTADARTAQIDPYTIVKTADLSADDALAAQVILDDWTTATIDLARQAYEKRLAFDVTQKEMSIRMRRLQASMAEDGGGFDVNEWQRLYTEFQEKPQRDVTEAFERIGESLVSASEQVASSLSAEGRERFQQAMLEARYPAVYLDQACVIDHLERAMKFDDLDADQSTRLARLLVTYRQQWTESSQRIVDLVRTVRRSTMTLEPDEIRDMQTKNRQLTELAFERSEYSTRAANQIRLILREDQLVRLGGLPDPETDSPISIWSF